MADTASRLTDLVEAERAALLTGDFDQMTSLLEEKQALVLLLEDDPDAASVLEPLRAAMLRNQVLYDRALEGLRSVTARLGALDTARRSIRTYDCLGQAQTIATVKPATLERRA